MLLGTPVLALENEHSYDATQLVRAYHLRPLGDLPGRLARRLVSEHTHRRLEVGVGSEKDGFADGRGQGELGWQGEGVESKGAAAQAAHVPGPVQVVQGKGLLPLRAIVVEVQVTVVVSDRHDEMPEIVLGERDVGQVEHVERADDDGGSRINELLHPSPGGPEAGALLLVVVPDPQSLGDALVEVEGAGAEEHHRLAAELEVCHAPVASHARHHRLAQFVPVVGQHISQADNVAHLRGLVGNTADTSLHGRASLRVQIRIALSPRIWHLSASIGQQGWSLCPLGYSPVISWLLKPA